MQNHSSACVLAPFVHLNWLEASPLIQTPLANLGQSTWRLVKLMRSCYHSVSIHQVKLQTEKANHLTPNSLRKDKELNPLMIEIGELWADLPRFDGMSSLGTNRFLAGIWTLKVEDHEAKLNLCQKDWGIRGCRILGDFCLKGKSKMKKLDMFDGNYSQVQRYFFGFLRALFCQGSTWYLYSWSAASVLIKTCRSTSKTATSCNKALRRHCNSFMNSPCWSLHLQGVPHVYVHFSAKVDHDTSLDAC